MDYKMEKTKQIIREGIVAHDQNLIIKKHGNPYAGKEHVVLDHQALNRTVDEIYKQLEWKGLLR